MIVTAQINKAKNVGGTMILLIQNRTRNLEIFMSASPVCRNQYKNRQSNPAADISLKIGHPVSKHGNLQSIPALSGR